MSRGLGDVYKRQEYNNGHKPVRFDGDNSYPYNFDRLKMLFGIDDTEEDDDE